MVPASPAPATRVDGRDPPPSADAPRSAEAASVDLHASIAEIEDEDGEPCSQVAAQSGENRQSADPRWILGHCHRRRQCAAAGFLPSQPERMIRPGRLDRHCPSPRSVTWAGRRLHPIRSAGGTDLSRASPPASTNETRAASAANQATTEASSFDQGMSAGSQTLELHLWSCISGSARHPRGFASSGPESPATLSRVGRAWARGCWSAAGTRWACRSRAAGGDRGGRRR